MKKLLKLSTEELIVRANALKKNLSLDLCSIMNAKSGICPEDCRFCAQSSHYKTEILRYPLKSKGEILERAEFAKEIGAKRFGIVTSGTKPTKKELEEIAKALEEIRGISLCASFGRLSQPEVLMLKEAGLCRYHHNIETSERFFSKVVSSYSFEEKLKTIENAKNVGLEVCSGGIIGMGETEEDRLDMAILLKSLEVTSVPINVLIPMKHTPFENYKPISPMDVIRCIALFRIILKDKTIKLAAGRESLGAFEGMAFFAGANGAIIGGYLTIKGRDVIDDKRFIKEIEKLATKTPRCLTTNEH